MLKQLIKAQLATDSEILELRNTLSLIGAGKPVSVHYKPIVGLKLKRTFNQFGIKFWRVVGPESSPSLNSDLSIAGLIDWQLIQVQEAL